jgi:hypothetical protein
MPGSAPGTYARRSNRPADSARSGRATSLARADRPAYAARSALGLAALLGYGGARS